MYVVSLAISFHRSVMLVSVWLTVSTPLTGGGAGLMENKHGRQQEKKPLVKKEKAYFYNVLMSLSSSLISFRGNLYVPFYTKLISLKFFLQPVNELPCNDKSPLLRKPLGSNRTTALWCHKGHRSKATHPARCLLCSLKTTWQLPQTIRFSRKLKVSVWAGGSKHRAKYAALWREKWIISYQWKQSD